MEQAGQKNSLISVHCVGQHNKRLCIQAQIAQHRSTISSVCDVYNHNPTDAVQCQYYYKQLEKRGSCPTLMKLNKTNRSLLQEKRSNFSNS